MSFAQGTSAKPALSVVYIEGTEERRFTLPSRPFTIGRRDGSDLVISDPRISRDHAIIVSEADGSYLLDPGSKLGTYINGERISRHKLQPNDKIEFGPAGLGYMIFCPDAPASSGARQFLTQLSFVKPAGAAGDLETLKLFLEAARKLNSSAVLEDVLVTLLDATLKLTRAERGFVFLVNPDNSLKLAAGRNAKGQPITDEQTISRSILRDALSGANEFLITDGDGLDQLAGRQSVVAQNLRSVVCIPLRRRIHDNATGAADDATGIRGVLYLDSHFVSGKLTQVSTDLLRTIAAEAAALVENAFLVETEHQARKYEQELSIAASIQQRLMAVTIPDVPYARIKARSFACRAIGGDFYDIVLTEQGVGFAITDVCGKGVTAALLASILQGMIYSQLTQNLPLAEIIASANRFVCAKNIAGKYATAIVGMLRPNGQLEMVTCGHVPAVLCSDGSVKRLRESNLPVGLIPEATYESVTYQMKPGDKLILVTDGVTEAEDVAGDMFGDERLEQALQEVADCDYVLEMVKAYSGSIASTDDCTVVEISY